MDGTALALGIAGLVTTGGVAVWARVLDNRRHERQLAHDRAVVDRGELRALLDEAAGVMRRALWTHSKMFQALRANEAALVDGHVLSLNRLGEEASLMVGRLALRLGAEHEITCAYDTMADIYERMSERLQEALPTGFAKHVANRKGLAARLEAILQASEEEFRPARRHFIATAQKYVGADVAAVAEAVEARPGYS